MMKKLIFILTFLSYGFAFSSLKVKGLDIGTETDLEGNFELCLIEGD